jgi:hypothetical protein
MPSQRLRSDRGTCRPRGDGSRFRRLAVPGPSNSIETNGSSTGRPRKLEESRLWRVTTSLLLSPFLDRAATLPSTVPRLIYPCAFRNPREPAAGSPGSLTCPGLFERFLLIDTVGNCKRVADRFRSDEPKEVLFPMSRANNVAPAFARRRPNAPKWRGVSPPAPPGGWSR